MTPLESSDVTLQVVASLVIVILMTGSVIYTLERPFISQSSHKMIVIFLSTDHWSLCFQNFFCKSLIQAQTH